MSEQVQQTDPYLYALKMLFWLVVGAVVVVVAVNVWPAVRWLINTLTPFIIGLVLAYIFHPIVVHVQHRWKLGHRAGIAVVAVGVILSLLAFLAVLLPILYIQIGAMLDALGEALTPANIEKFRARLPYDKIPPEFLNYLERAVGELDADFTALLSPVTESGAAGAVSSGFNLVMGVFGWVGGTIALITISVLAALYFLISIHKIPGIIRRLLPGPDRERLWDTLLRSERAVGGFLRGQLVACIGVGLLVTILLFAIGPRKYAILIGFTAGAVNFIPYLGPTVGATPAILWAIFASSLPFFGGFDPATGAPLPPDFGDRLGQIALIVAGFSVIQAIDGFVFQPYIVGAQAALHPLTVMLALVVGSRFGLVGMILAVPTACVAKVFFLEYYWNARSDFAVEALGAEREFTVEEKFTPPPAIDVSPAAAPPSPPAEVAD